MGADWPLTVAGSCRQKQAPFHPRAACCLPDGALPAYDTLPLPPPLSSNCMQAIRSVRHVAVQHMCVQHMCVRHMWGSMRVRRHQFDPKADLYSLSFCFAEVGSCCC